MMKFFRFLFRTPFSVPFYCQRGLIQCRYFGQPAFQTHPHLLQNGEVTPGITKQEYRNRRHSLMNEIVKHEHGANKDHVVIVPSAVRTYMTQDIPYIFRQNTDFLYLCGFQEPGSVLLLEMCSGADQKSKLFVPKKDAHAELWEGPRSGREGSVTLTGVDEAYDIEDFGSYLSTLLKANESNLAIWCDTKKSANLELQNNVVRPLLCTRAKSIRSFMHKIRSIKSHSEIQLMQKSCSIASESFVETMKYSYPGINEAHLFAKMDFECRIRDAEFLAYPPVVAGGNRANTIHYIANNQLIQGDDMVLMDAGCEYHGYASDITRTWPVSGKFSKAQRLLYDIVLDVQEACIALCHEGSTLNAIYMYMNSLFAQHLKHVDLIPRELGPVESQQAMREFCPHHVGHYLGMDVHDTDEMSRSTPLTAGMVITIEPGLYIPRGKAGVPAEFTGIGIRIEDNVMITGGKPCVLSASCPKHPNTIETLMRK